MGGRSGPRSKTGCWMCRERKIKCDEVRPVCGRCAKAGRQCDYTVREPPRPAAARSSSQPLLMPKASAAGLGSSPGEIPEARSYPPSLTSLPAFSNPWGDYSTTGITQSVAAESEGDVQTTYTTHSDPTQQSGPFPIVPTASNTGISPSYDSKVMSHFQDNFVISMQTKAPRWGFMNGLMHICRSDPVLMHFMLAVVGHEASSAEKRPGEQLNAIEHYRRGLVDFNNKISNGDYERHTLLIAIWLLTQYELRFAERGRDIQRHFEGFNQAILAYNYDLLPGLRPPDVSSSSEKGKEKASTPPMQSAFKLPRSLYSNVINRLGLWVAYMDACASTFDLDGGVMYTLLHTFDSNSIHHIFAGSREALKDIWGNEYPATEALDDLQNRPAFDAFHHFHILRFKISEFRRSLKSQTSGPHQTQINHPEKDFAASSTDSYEQNRDAMINHINSLSQQYSSLIKIASTWPLPEQKPDRLTLNLRFIIAFFYTCILEFYALVADPRLPPLPTTRSNLQSQTRSVSSPAIPYSPHPQTPQILPDPNAPLPPTSTKLPPEGLAALNYVLKICTIVHETEGVASLSRCNWPLFVAGIECKDIVHQSWCVERLETLGKQGVNNVRACKVLKAVVGVRRVGGRNMRVPGTGDSEGYGGRSGSGRYGPEEAEGGGDQGENLNWREWIKSGSFEEFVV